MASRKPPPPLAEAQLEIMNILWRSGEGTVADVLAQVRPARAGQVGTRSRRCCRGLDEKGWLKHREEGGTFFYFRPSRVQRRRFGPSGVSSTRYSTVPRLAS